MEFPADLHFPAHNRSDEDVEKALKKDCLLWDKTCSGNETEAKDDFFLVDGLKNYLITGNSTCFRDEIGCTPEMASQFPKMKSFMRGEECALIQDNQYNRMSENSPFYQPPRNCCKACALLGNNVELFYWPDPEADTSCLSIVGDTILPVGYGGTIDDRLGTSKTYWGCTKDKKTTRIESVEGKARIESSLVTGRSIMAKISEPGTGLWPTTMSPLPDRWDTTTIQAWSNITHTEKVTISTAEVTTVYGTVAGTADYYRRNSLSYKKYIIDPWGKHVNPQAKPPQHS